MFRPFSRQVAARAVVFWMIVFGVAHVAPQPGHVPLDWPQAGALWAQEPATASSSRLPAGATSDARAPHVTIPVQQLETLLSRRDVIAELGLLDTQIRDISERIRTARRDLDRATRFAPGTKPEEARKAQTQVLDIHFKAKEQVEQLLLPHQAQRMRQLSVQFRYPQGTPHVYLSDDFVRELEYSDEQREAIRDEISASEREIREAVERVLANTRSRIQARLTTTQRAKADELIGTPFTFARETPEEVRARIRGASVKQR